MKLNVRDLACCLHLPSDTLERWIRQGRIPVKKTDVLCEFKKDALESWAVKHHIRFSLEDIARDENPAGEIHTIDYPLVKALEQGGVHGGLEGDTVEEVLKQAASCVPSLSDEEKDELYIRLVERERLTSTGIGKGVAIPHPRSPLPGNQRAAMIATCFLKNSVDFQAIDQIPVKVLFVLVCPSVKTHLFLLSRVSFCLRDDSFITLLSRSPSPADFFQAVMEREERLGKA